MPREEWAKPAIMGADKMAATKDGKALTWWKLGKEHGAGSVPAEADGKWPEDMLMEGKSINVFWYQPKEAKTYTIPRYASGDKVDTYASPFTPPEEGEEIKGVPCMKGVSLSGAATLAAASLTAAAIALF